MGRLADNADSLIRDLDEKAISKYNTGKNAANPKITIPTKDETEPVTKQTYKVIDSDKMANDVKNHPSLDDNAKTAINNAITDYVCCIPASVAGDANSVISNRLQIIPMMRSCLRKQVRAELRTIGTSRQHRQFRVFSKPLFLDHVHSCGRFRFSCIQFFFSSSSLIILLLQNRKTNWFRDFKNFPSARLSLGFCGI